MDLPEFDMEAFEQQWAAEQATQAETATDEEVIDQFEVVEDAEFVADEGLVGDGQDGPEEEEIVVPDVAPPINDPDVEKRNSAFAQLRRERDEAAQLASFLQKIADDNGISVEEMMKNYEESQIQEQAETQGIPVDALKRIQATERELESLKSKSFSERFNNEVTSTMEKYNASQEDVEAVFAYAAQNGLVQTIQSGAMNFETAYKLANMDTMLEKAKSDALQESLSQKKKRQQQAPLVHTSSAPPTAETHEEMAIRDAKEIMASGGF